MLKGLVEDLNAISQSLALLGHQCALLLWPADQEGALLPTQVQQLLLKGGGFRCCFWVLPEHRGGIGTGIKHREGQKFSMHVAAEVGNVGREEKGMGT